MLVRMTQAEPDAQRWMKSRQCIHPREIPRCARNDGFQKSEWRSCVDPLYSPEKSSAANRSGAEWLRIVPQDWKFLVFAVEDKVWKSEEGAGVFGIVAALDTGFGATGVIVGERTSTIEGARLMHQSDNRFGLNADEIFFFEYPGNEFAGVAMTIFHGVDQGQSD